VKNHVGLIRGLDRIMGSPPESVGEIVWTFNHLRPVGF
jgi:hypothetical protein